MTTFRPLTLADVPASRDLRLEALRNHPEAFGSDYNDLVNAGESFWLDRVRGSFENGDYARVTLAESAGQLVGMAGTIRETGAKVRHQAFIWGVYVRPAFRGQGVAAGLIHACVEWCREKQLRGVRLSVEAGNVSAIRCYARLGFNVFGVQRDVIRVGDVYHDELLMYRKLKNDE